MKKIKFISYDGEYPRLCYGKLIVEIDGKKIVFGNENSDYPRFWDSGGSVSFDKDWNACVSRGDWMLDYDEKKFPFDEDTMEQLITVMNENVQLGCCGGCV